MKARRKSAAAFALCAFLAAAAHAAAPNPTAVWEAGEFDQTKNGYSITIPDGVMKENGKIVIGQSATKGALIALTDVVSGGADAVTVLYKYSTFTTPSDCRFAASVCYSDSTKDYCYDLGFINWSGTNLGLLPAWHKSSTDKENGFNKKSDNTANFTDAMSTSGGYVALSYSASSHDIGGYQGGSVSAMTGGTQSGYSFSGYNGKITYVCLGGPSGQTASNKWGTWPGLAIEKVAIFVGNAYTAADFADFVWPSEEYEASATRYAKWNYAASDRVRTWQTPSSKKFSDGAKYSVFDLTTFTDTETTADAGWQYFAYSTGAQVNNANPYAAPGTVLRFVDGAYQKANITADFTPLIFGGLIVESGARGYSLGDDGTRATILGDPSGDATRETWFQFFEDFAINRDDGCHIDGTVNIDVKYGKTFTIKGDTAINKSGTIAANALPTAVSGGTLRLHGNGTLAAKLDATGATLDFSDLADRKASAPYISGSVTVGAGTKILLPAGAESPYRIATSGSGTLDSDAVSVGGETFSGTVSFGGGCVVLATPQEITISEDAVWPTGWESGGIYTVNVAENSGEVTLAASSAEAGEITFDIGDGSTLTLDGAVSAAKIRVTGAGTLKLTAADALGGDNAGTIVGDGTILYSGGSAGTAILPPSGRGWTDATAWTGTLAVENSTKEQKGWKFNNYGNDSSTLRFSNVKMYLDQSESDGTVTVKPTVNLTGEGMWISDGNGKSVVAIPKLTGDGAIKITGGSSSGNGLVLQNNASGWTGAISNTTSGESLRYRVTFGSSGSYGTEGKIVVASGASVSVAAGKTWTAAGGIEVNGTLSVGAGATVPKLVSGSAGVIAAMSGGIATISGFGASSGTSATLDATLGIVSRNDTLAVVDSSTTELTLTQEKITNNGTLDLSGMTALTTLNVIVGTASSLAIGTVNYPASLAKVNVIATEPEGADGAISFNATSYGGSVAPTYKVVLSDGTGTVYAKMSDGRLSYPLVSGEATAYDVTFTNVSAFAYARTAAGVNANGAAASDYNNNLADATTGLYLYKRPYITTNNSNDLGDLANLQSSMTLAVVGQMPSVKACATFIHLGGCGNGYNGLLIARGETDNEVIVAYNQAGAVTELTKMKVPNASTARHAYVIKKEDGASSTTFTIYLDGKKWKTVSLSFKLTVSGGVQVGSDFHGQIHTQLQSDGRRYNSITKEATSDVGFVVDTTGYVNAIRIFDRLITDSEIAQLSEEYPYVSPNGTSRRTFAADEESWIDAADGSEVWDNGADRSGTPTANASLEVSGVGDAERTVKVNLAAETQYEALSVNSGAALKFVNASDGAKPVAVSGMTVIGAPVEIQYGAVDMTGGPVTITEDGSLAFDCSALDLSQVYSTTYYPLTGETAELSESELAAGKISLTAPSALPANVASCSLAYRDGAYCMKVVPAHEGGEVYYKSGYIGSDGSDGLPTFVDSAGTEFNALFPGDVVVIDSAHCAGDAAWASSELPENLTAIRIAKDFTVKPGTEDAILPGVAVTVDEGVSLTFARDDGSTRDLALGALTLNGPGAVAFDNGSGEVTLSGAVGGTAAVSVASGKAVRLGAGGSLANALSGAGEVALANASQTLTFGDDWTGRVVVSEFQAEGPNFANWGKAGSTVVVNGLTGWINPDAAAIAPDVELAGNFAITAMSVREYSFAGVSGAGRLSFAPGDNNPTSISIATLSGTGVEIGNETDKTVVIGTLALPAGASVEPGAKLLSATGGVRVDAVTVGGAAVSPRLSYRADGVYSARTAIIVVR